MKWLPIQVEVIPFRRTGDDHHPVRVLILNRTLSRGGMWQFPVGAMSDGESLARTAARVAREYLGIGTPHALINLNMLVQQPMAGKYVTTYCFACETREEDVILNEAEFSLGEWCTGRQAGEKLRDRFSCRGLDKLLQWDQQRRKG